MRFLTPHFTLEEFLASDTAEKIGNDNEPTAEHLENLKATADFMETIRVRLKRSIVVFSGYRNPAVNAYVGGVPNSDHARGLACDSRAAGLSALAYARFIEAQADLTWDQLILEASRGVVHVGLGSRMRRQVLRQPGAAGSPVLVGLE